MTKIFRNQKIWFCAFLKKLLGIQSPSCRALYGLKYEFDYLRSKRTIDVEFVKLREEIDEIMQNIGGSTHEQNL